MFINLSGQVIPHSEDTDFERRFALLAECMVSAFYLLASATGYDKFTAENLSDTFILNKSELHKAVHEKHSMMLARLDSAASFIANRVGFASNDSHTLWGVHVEEILTTPKQQAAFQVSFSIEIDLVSNSVGELIKLRKEFVIDLDPK